MRREDELGRKHGSGDPEKKREKDASKSATLKDSRKKKEKTHPMQTSLVLLRAMSMTDL